MSIFIGQEQVVSAQSSTIASELVKQDQKAFLKSAKAMGFKSSMLKAITSGISSLDDSYCTNASVVEITPDDWNGAASITWKVRTTVGGTEFHEDDWCVISGSGQSTVLQFYPDRVGDSSYGGDAKYYGYPIYFDYYLYDEDDGPLGIGTASTLVFLYPNIYTLSATDEEICNGESTSIVLSSSDSGISYELRDESENAISSVYIGDGTDLSWTVSPTETTTYHIYAENTDENASCDGNFTGETVTVTVHDPVTITATNDGPVCVGDPINLYVDVSGLSYSWTGPDGFTSTDQNPTISAATAAKDGTYSVDIVDGNSCGNSASTTVVVNDLPIPSLLGDSDPCINQAGYIYQTDAGNSNYAWSITGGVITSGSSTNAVTVTWNTSGTQTIAVSYTDTNGCGADAATEYEVTVQDLPIPVISGDSEVCVNEQGVYSTDSGMSNYVWTVSAGGNIISGAGTEEITVEWLGVGDQKVTVTYDNTYGCSPVSPTEYDVYINALPVASVTSGETSVCLDESGLQYTTQSGMSNYAWTITGGTITAGSTTNTITVTWDQVGAQEITVTYEDGNSCSPATPGAYSVTVNDLPTPTITGATEVCENESGVTYYTESGKSNYTWTITGGTIVSGAGTYQISVDWGASGTGTVVVNYEENGCAAANDTEESVTIQAPATPSILGSDEECEGATNISYQTDGSMTGYVWSVTSGGTITSGQGTNSIEVTWNTSGSQSVSVYYYNSLGCLSETSTYAVTVDALPVPTISGDNETCLNSTGNEYTTESGMSNYSWTIVGGTIDEDNGESVKVTWTSTGIQTISVSYDDTNGCSTSSPTNYSVTVYSLPSVTISGNTDVCLNSTSTYSTQSGMSSYSWTVVGGTITSGASTNSVDVLWDTSGAQSISVNYVNANGCSAASDYSYPVNVIEPATPLISGSTEECLNTTGVIYNTESGMSNYSWTIVGGTITNGQGTDEITVTWTAAGTGTLVVSYTDGNTCEAYSNTYEVIINDLPVPVITGSTDVCQGYNETYTTESGMSNYDWTLSSGGSIVSGGDGSDFIEVLWDNSGTQTLSVTYEDTNGCNPASATEVNIVVTAKPTPTISPATTSACNLSTTTFSTESGKINYSWIVTGGTIVSGDGTNSIQVQWSTAGSQSVEVNYDNSNGCSGGTAATSSVEVFSLPAPSLIGDNAACIGESKTYQTDNTGTESNYVWTITGGTIDSGQNTNEVTVTWNTEGEGTITVNYDNADGCPAETATSYSVDVYDITVDLTVTIPTSGSTAICSGTDATFTATGANGSDPTNYVYEFFVDDVSQGAASSTSTFNYTVTSNVVVKVDITDSSTGCTESTSLNITALETPVVSLDSPVDGDEFCYGETVDFTASALGTVTNYTFYDKTNDVSYNNGTLGYYTQADGFTSDVTVYVIASNGSCSANSNEVNLTIHDLPVPSMIAAPSTKITEGTEVTFTATGGIEYEFFVNGTSEQLRSTTDNFITSSLVNGDVVRVDVYDTNGCMASTQLTIQVLDAIDDVAVTPVGGSSDYCEGDGGISIQIGVPQIDVTYRLEGDITGSISAITYNGTNMVRWDNILGTDTYRVYAYYDDSEITDAEFELTDNITVTENILPTIHNVYSEDSSNDTESGCNGGTGWDISLDGSEVDVTYTLYLNGSELATASGTGSSISFGAFNVVGEYTVSATNDNTGCSEVMNASFTIVGDGSDVAFTLSAVNPANESDPTDGRYCAGDEGVYLELDGSLDATVTYKLYRNGIDTGIPLAGADGATLTFGPVTQEGDYTVRVESSSGCTFPMDGYVTVSIIAIPTAYDLTTDNSIDNTNGNYCSGDAGVRLILSDQETDVVYYIYRDGVDTGVSVTGTAPGSQLDLGTFTDEGVYTILAQVPQVGCSMDMNNSITVTIIDDPALVSVTNDQDYFCTGNATYLTISNPEIGVEYRWVNQDDASYGAWQEATSSGVMSFEISAAGTYVVEGRYVDAYTECGAVTMDGGPFVITESTLPVGFTISSSGDGDAATCLGEAIIVQSSLSGITYTLVTYDGSDYIEVSDIDPIDGDGSDIQFERISDSGGEYYVIATNDKGCETMSSNSVNINIVGAVKKQLMTGEGEICMGELFEGFGLESSEVGVEYSLYREGTTDAVDVVSGTGSAIEFGSVTTQGTYYVIGYNTSSGCSNEMMNTKILLVHDLPVAYAMTGSGISCDLANDGATIGIEDFEENTTYYLLYRASESDFYAVKDEIVTSAATSEVQSIVYEAGQYMYVARNDYGCTSNMNSTIWVDEYTLPESKVVSYDDGYCSGTEGVEITIDEAEEDIYYQVIDASTGDAVTDAVTGTTSLGMYTAGTYNVVAYREGGACAITLEDSNGESNIVITENTDVPVVYNMTGNGVTCDLANTGVVLGIDGFEVGITYTLMYRADETADYVSVATITPDTETTAVENTIYSEGEFMYVATNANGCSSDMDGTITVTEYAQPESKTVLFDASGYCSGNEDGLELTLNEVEEGVYYQVFEVTGEGDVAVSDAITGTTSLGSYVEGTYHVVAYREGGACEITLTDESGSEDIIISASGVAPSVMEMYGDNITCDIAAGVILGLEGTPEVDVTYTLRYRAKGETSYVDVATLISDGTTPIENTVYSEGEYMYVAENSYGCTTLMANTVQVKEYSLPATVEVSVVGDSYCPDDEGAEIVISEAEVDIYYQVFSLDTGDESDPVTGSTSLGIFTEGTYYVVAYREGGTCMTTMADDIIITAGDIPNANLEITCAGETSDCTAGDDLCITTTEVGVTYTLYLDDVNTGQALAGTGEEVCFTTSAGGRYTIEAVNDASGCSVEINGYLDYNECDLPDVSTITLTCNGYTNDCNVGNEICISYSEVSYNYSLYWENITSKQTLNGTGDELCFDSESADEVGTYTVRVIDPNNGCYTVIPDELYLNDYDDFQLVDDYFYFGKDLNTDAIYLNRESYNDIFVWPVDVTLKDSTRADYDASKLNITFALVEQNSEGNWEQKNTIKKDRVGTYTIDAATSKLTLQKVANFFGKDSVKYIAYNEEDDSRIDTATVYVYIGNKYFDDEDISIMIPNAFSPNGDNTNDYFKITGINEYYEQKYSTSDIVIVSDIEIFNRWGTIVYRSKDTYYGESEWWDGKSTESNMVSIGQDCPNGTYFYVFTVKVNIEGTIKEDKFQGYIELRR